MISGNGTGVGIYGAGTSEDNVEGNFIGTDVSGAIAIPNAIGVQIFNGILMTTSAGRRRAQGT